VKLDIEGIETLAAADRHQVLTTLGAVKRRAIGTPYRRRIGTPCSSPWISGEARSHQPAQRVAAG